MEQAVCDNSATPFIIAASARTPRHPDQARRHGVFGNTPRSNLSPLRIIATRLFRTCPRHRPAIPRPVLHVDL